jgi:hypothetical protein
MTLSDTEFRVLRETIAARGTTRMALLPLTMIGWALIAGGILLLTELPFAGVFSLGVLVGGFEAIHALHVGVERIGRYLQVYYEAGGDGPLWESTAMRLGPGLPGAGVDPLFTVVFVAATMANLMLVFIPQPTRLDLGVLGVVHLAFLVRVVRARGAAARQRAVDLETFRAIHTQMAPPRSHNSRSDSPTV